MRALYELKRIISEAENIVFFGGAGVSTDSGIPDFRGNGGLYTERNEFGETPASILTSRCLKTNPQQFYAFYRGKMIHPYAQPNDAHIALARLEQEGKLSTVITQNIDGLHQAAGSQNVLELHGSVRRNYCTRCGKLHDLNYILDSYDIPLCKTCGSVVRPDVVLYGEGLDNEAFSLAQEAIYDADVLIVGGSSLTVYPAASLVQEFEGEHLIIINATPTQYDEYAELVIREPIAEVMRKVMD